MLFLRITAGSEKSNRHVLVIGVMSKVFTFQLISVLMPLSHQVSMTIEPNVTIVGGETTLECEKQNVEAYINWYHRSTHSIDFVEFLAGDQLLSVIRKHFVQDITIAESEPGHSVLKITNVEKLHGGTFKCCDDEKCKHFEGTAELSVLGEII